MQICFLYFLVYNITFRFLTVQSRVYIQQIILIPLFIAMISDKPFIFLGSTHRIGGIGHIIDGDVCLGHA